MTANRDLKRRVRDRQSHTGESYMTALQQVLGSLDEVVNDPLIELIKDARAKRVLP